MHHSIVCVECWNCHGAFTVAVERTDKVGFYTNNTSKKCAHCGEYNILRGIRE